MKCSNCGREIYSNSCPFCGNSGYGFGFNNTESQGSNSSLGFGNTPFGQNDFGTSGNSSSGNNFGNSGNSFSSGSGFGGGFGQGFYQPSPPKKHNNNWLIILICAIGAIALLTAIILFANGSDTYNPYPAYTGEPTYTDNTVPTYTYVQEDTTTDDQQPVYTYPILTFPVYTDEVTEPITSTTAATTTEEPTVVEPSPSDIIPFFELRYFLNALNDEELEIVCAVYEGLMNFEERIALPHITSPERFFTLIEILHYECPELFQYDFASSYSYYYTSGSSSLIDAVELPYTCSKNEYLAMRRQCEDVINSFIVATNGLSDIEKEKYVYDWFGSHCHYNAEKPQSGNPYSALLNGYAKCDGFSLATKWAMESMGIQCLCVSANALDGGIGHAWNIININGNYYLLDTTFGVPTDSSVALGIDFQTYSGFNTAETWANEKYTIEPAFPEVAPVPVCNITTGSYYALRGGLVQSGANPVDVIVSKLGDLENGTIDKIELQFENAADYNAFVQNSGDRIKEALTTYGASWSGTNSFTFDYYAFILFVNFR